MAKEFTKRTFKEIEALTRLLGGGRRTLEYQLDRRKKRPDSAEPLIRRFENGGYDGTGEITVDWGSEGTLLGGLLTGEMLQETPIEAADKIRIRFAEAPEGLGSQYWTNENWKRSQAFFDSWEAIERLRIARMAGEWYDDPRIEPWVHAAMNRDPERTPSRYGGPEGSSEYAGGHHAEQWAEVRNSVIRSAKASKPRTDSEKLIEELFGDDIREAADSDSAADALLTASAIAEHLILTDKTNPDNNEGGDNESDNNEEDDNEGGDIPFNLPLIIDLSKGANTPAGESAMPPPPPNKQGMQRKGRQKVVEALGLNFGDIARMQEMSQKEFGAEFGLAMKAALPERPPIDGKHTQNILVLPAEPMVLRHDTKLFLDDMQDTTGEVLRKTGVPTSEAWKLNLGQLRVFRQRPKRKGKIVVIVDLSGSMGGWCDHAEHRTTGEGFFAFEIAAAIESQFSDVQVFGFASSYAGTNFVRIPKGQKLACPVEHDSISALGSGTPLCAALQFASDELEGIYSGSSTVFITDGGNTGARGFVDNPGGECDGYDHHRRVSEEMHASGMRFLNIITSNGGGTHLPQDLTVEVLSHDDIPKLAEAFKYLKRRH